MAHKIKQLSFDISWRSAQKHIILFMVIMSPNAIEERYGKGLEGYEVIMTRSRMWEMG
jgi:hypothetical protein